MTANPPGVYEPNSQVEEKQEPTYTAEVQPNGEPDSQHQPSEKQTDNGEEGEKPQVLEGIDATEE